MGKKLMGNPPPAEAACGDSAIDIGEDESLLILIKHCKDMKHQETWLRLITVLLLLSCVALILFINYFHVQKWDNSAFNRPGGEVAQSPSYSKQEGGCPADSSFPPTTHSSQRPHIHLMSLPTPKDGDKQCIKWKVVFGEKYNEEKRSIVISQTGVYFIYLRLELKCNERTDDATLKFFVQLQKWNVAYNNTESLADARDGITCTQISRTVFVGELFDLLEGDHVSVNVKEGYGLITKSSFGAYSISHRT